MKKALKIVMIILVIIIVSNILFLVTDFFLRKNIPNKTTNTQTNSGEIIEIKADPTAEVVWEKKWSPEERFRDPEGYQRALESRTLDKVSIKVKEDTITPTGATFVITDKNEVSCGYTKEYKIERNLFGLWVPVIPITYIISVEGSYSTLLKESVEHKEDWSNRYGALRKGKYRFSQKVYDNQEYQYIHAEFSI